jgi:hypothetical protein
VSVAHLPGVYGGDVPSQPHELMCSPPVKLEDVQVANAIHFVAVGPRCVYDYQCPQVFDSWLFETVAMATAAASVDAEQDEDDGGGGGEADRAMKALSLADATAPTAVAAGADDDDESEHVVVAAAAAGAAGGGDSDTPLLGFEQLWRLASAHVLPFLADAEMVRLSLCSKGLKQQCVENEVFRKRRRELFNSVAGDYSKARKAEQKKKVKQANARKAGAYTSTVKRCY